MKIILETGLGNLMSLGQDIFLRKYSWARISLRINSVNLKAYKANIRKDCHPPPIITAFKKMTTTSIYRLTY